MIADSFTELRWRMPHSRAPELPLFAFLPGLDGTGALLQTQIAELERHFDIRCLALPPHNRSDWPTLIARTIALVRSECRPGRRVFLCGESFGGCLALSVALGAPELCDRLILVNPASSFNERPYLKLATAVLPWLPETAYQGLTQTILPLLTANRPIDSGVREALVAAMKSVPPKTAGWRLSLLGAFEVEPSRLRELSCPTLLVAGGSDRLLPSVTEAERLAAVLPEAKVEILPESGHTCLLETDTHLYEILHARDFLPVMQRRDRLQNTEKMR